MKTKVGSPPVDPGPARRFAIAIPSAIVITAALVLLARMQPADRPDIELVPQAVSIVLERAARTPLPTPRPPRRPTPPPARATPVAVVIVAPVPQRVAAPRVARRAGGGTHAAPRAHAHVVAAATTYAVANAPGGSGNAANAGTGEGNGTGAGSGSGSGAGAGDPAGTGSVNADAPCGYVDLLPYEAPEHRGRTVLEHVNATVMFPDGHTESDQFPYPWVYTDPDADPWSPRNMRDQNFIVRVQFPAARDTARYSSVIRYILDHTREDDGTTRLQECPRPR